MNVFIETLSKSLWHSYFQKVLFLVVIRVLIFLNLASDICRPYNNNLMEHWN